MWLIIGGAALLAIVVVAAVVVVTAAPERPQASGGGGERKLLRAPVRPMPSPQAPEGSSTGIPSDCGVSSAALERVMPKRGHGEGPLSGSSGRCEWTSEHDGRFHNLTVEINPAKVSTGGAVGHFGNEVTVLERSGGSWPSLKVVANLGVEAYAWYSAPSYPAGVSTATILMRTENAVAKIKYFGRTHGPEVGGLPESQLMPSALQVTREIAKSLGASGNQEPTITDIPDTPPSVHARRAACAAVSTETQRRLLGKPSAGSTVLGSDFLTAPVHQSRQTDNCFWSGRPGNLTVDTLTLTDALEGEDAQAARTLEWLQWGVRQDGLSSTGRTATVLALTGYGDGAFAAYEPPDSDAGHGLVAFRIRNALIKVTYEGVNTSRPLTQDQAINGAYIAAVEVAATLKP